MHSTSLATGAQVATCRPGRVLCLGGYYYNLLLMTVKLLIAMCVLDACHVPKCTQIYLVDGVNGQSQS